MWEQIRWVPNFYNTNLTYCSSRNSYSISHKDFHWCLVTFRKVVKDHLRILIWHFHTQSHIQTYLCLLQDSRAVLSIFILKPVLQLKTFSEELFIIRTHLYPLPPYPFMDTPDHVLHTLRLVDHALWHVKVVKHYYPFSVKNVRLIMFYRDWPNVCALHTYV